YVTSLPHFLFFRDLHNRRFPSSLNPPAPSTVTKPSTAQRLEPRLATTAAERVTFPRIVQESQKLKLATSVPKKVTFRVIAHKLTPPHREETVGTAETVAKNATSAGKSVTLLATAAATATAEIPVPVSTTAVPVRNLVTLAVVSDTFLATADRVPNATTVPVLVTSVGSALSPRSVLATPVARKGISLVTVPTRARRRHNVPYSPSSALFVPYLSSMISCA
ncbi:hypothetical protein BJ322DRAFT_16315, partial [Thelephora terrestris]